MAEKKLACQHTAQSCISFYTAGWDIKEARRLIEESQHLSPRPIVIFVHPSVNQLAFTRDRQNKAIARTTSANKTAEPRRMGRIKITKEDCKQITGSE